MCWQGLWTCVDCLKLYQSSISHLLTQLNHNTVLFQIIQFSISTQIFVYTQLNIKTGLFQTTQFRMSTQIKCQTVLFDPYIYNPIRFYHSESEWTWEDWWGRNNPHSLWHYRLFNVKSKTLVGRVVLPLRRNEVGVFNSPSPLGQRFCVLDECYRSKFL